MNRQRKIRILTKLAQDRKPGEIMPPPVGPLGEFKGEIQRVDTTPKTPPAKVKKVVDIASSQALRGVLKGNKALKHMQKQQNLVKKKGTFNFDQAY